MLQNTAVLADLQGPEEKIFAHLGALCKLAVPGIHRLAKTTFLLGPDTGGGF